LTVSTERERPGHGLRIQGLNDRWLPDKNRRFRVIKKIAEFGLRVGGVEWKINSAELQGREIKAHRFGRFRHLHGDPVTRTDTGLVE
jgi:hypothetical protein